LRRCHDGLRADAEAFAPAEAAWVVRRVAELQEWAPPAWLADRRRRSIGSPVKAPQRLRSLLEEGLIDSVVRQLMSGKEATVYVVRCGEETRCAKVYKEATQRSFRQAVDYTENRKVKNSRQARAMAKGTRFGRQAQEAAWQSAEVDALHRLAAAGVRVPKPFNFHDGVLLMELVVDAHGGRRAAPQRRRLHGGGGASASRHPDRRSRADAVRRRRPRRPVGVQHPARRRRPGDHRPAAGGRRGRQQPRPRMLLRDVANLRDFFGRFAPDLLATQFGAEIWALYTRGVLQAASQLSGGSKRATDRSTWPASCASSTMPVTKRRRACCGCALRDESRRARPRLAMTAVVVGLS
jgi:RIO kinase 1